MLFADPEAKALFEARCSVCHSLSRPLRKSRERKWWIETVMRMQKVNGCPITDEEAWTIIDYLAIVRGPGVPRGPDDDVEHERGNRGPAPIGEPGSVPAVPSTSGGDPEARALFESKCSICHPVSRPLGKTKDRAGWTTTVTRMQKVNGCPITDEEAGVIIDYLTKIRGPAAR
jgi:cytochrome c5